MIRYLYERKKLLLFIVCALYCGLFYFDKHLGLSGNSSWSFSRSHIAINSLLVKESVKIGPSIAIGCGITSRKVRNVFDNNIGTKFQFLHTLLPTFCRTASLKYRYKFYLAYDSSDRVFTNMRLRDAFQRYFQATTTSGPCRDRDITADLCMVECKHTGKPAWAQNDAMMEAYLDHVDYFYRINDDTKMVTVGWTEKFISTLESYHPPLVGVVGPTDRAGSARTLKYDFVYRTHIDIFGFYYPRLFTDWWGDNWITQVYQPNRSTKMNRVRLVHTMRLGQRYIAHVNVRRHLRGQLTHDKDIVARYVKAVISNKETSVKPDGRKVISMSLYGKNHRYTWGVIRNAQLVPVYLPDWTLRVYVAADEAPPELSVPPRIINKLRLLGAEVIKVSTGNSLSPRNWRLLVANDEQVDYFLIRDADTRLSEREAVVVKDWLSAAEKNGPLSAVIHCIRDHPKHTDQAVVDGLWGGRPEALQQLLRQNIAEMIERAASKTSSSSVDRTNTTMTFMNQVLWPAVSNFSYCHDSVSPCDRWMPLLSRCQIPLPRQGRLYIGEKFDAHQQLISADGDRLGQDVVCPWDSLNTANTDISLNHTGHGNVTLPT